MRRAAKALAVLLLAGGALAQDDEPAPDARVVRCVLDRKCRALVVPLGDGLWAAWDTGACTIDKVWKGDVSWDGPVFTTVHGPQPTSRGQPLIEPLAGATWGLTANGVDTPLVASFVGYDAPPRGPVTLRWRLALPDGGSVLVQERPERLSDDGQEIRLRRSFEVSGLPSGAALTLSATGLPIDALLQRVGGGGKAAWRATYVEGPPGTDPPRTASTTLKFQENGAAEVTVNYEPLAPPAAEPATTAEAPEPEPAPDAVTPTDRRAALLAPPRDLADPSPTQPGIALRLWALDDWIMQLAPLERGQTPNVDVILRTLDLEGQDFKDLGGPEDAFLAQATATLTVETAGPCAFRLSSDDGSRLKLDGRELIDHDGLHSEEGKEATLELAAGPHALEAWMFEAAGGEVFRLEWKPPGATDFAPIPIERLSVPAGIVRVTSPGPKRTIRPLKRGRPGDGQWLEGVHPSFALSQARPEDWKPKVGGLALRGETLLVSTWDRDGAVWALDGARGGDASQIRPRRIASGLAEPLGLACDGDRVFVLQKQELTELIDRDGDGVTDFYRCAANGWQVTPNFHEFAFGLAERDGWLYATLAVAIDPGGRSSGRQAEGRGSVIRIHPDDGRFEVVAQGLRTPNGIGFGSDLGWTPGAGARPLYVADNQGDWLPSSKLVLVQDGAFYGSRAVLREKADGLRDTPPVVWLPQGEIGNSPSQPAPLPVGPWKGQMLVGDVTYGGLQRVAIERLGNTQNGCVFAFSQGLEAGVNRLCWATDGADAQGVGADLFVGGIGSTGNWGQEGKLRYGLQRLRYTGAPCFEMLDVRAGPGGLRVSFTEPLAAGAGLDPDGWFVESWRYEPTDSYGGPKLDQRENRIVAVTPAEDGLSVHLAIDDLETGRVFHLRALDELSSAAGRTLWTHEAWLTLNAVPSGNFMRPITPQTLGVDDLPLPAGTRALFDGRTLAGWHEHGAPQADGRFAPVRGWTVQDGALVRSGEGGDLVTDESFEDFELSLDWRLASGGNSGLFFLVDETPRADGSLPYVWESGIEMQVLDNERHRDGQDPLTSAGSCYALYAPTRDDTRPIGHWNRVRLVKRGAHVEHWLNGRLQCAYEIGSADWNERVAGSKFAAMPNFGKATRGRIALQDHGDEVAFRNVAIRSGP